MEDVNKAIERFLAVSYSSGYGYGYGSGSGYDYDYGDGTGYGYGTGTGSGSGSGSGYGYGSGSGSGYDYDYGTGTGSGTGSGSGYGSGSGSGSGSGYDYGDGTGYGYGSGSGLISFNRQKVHYIDGIATVIERVIGKLARGFIIRKDLVTEVCYIAKHNNLFAHGETEKKAEKALQDKIFATMDVDKKIEMFLAEFDLETEYPAKAFYEWHNKLTGSCEFGRKNFCKNHGIDLENGRYTVKEFIELTKDDYGGEIIEQLAERIEE